MSAGFEIRGLGVLGLTVLGFGVKSTTVRGSRVKVVRYLRTTGVETLAG